METYHSIFIGSGMNSLVGAALLSKEGKKVLVIEKSDYIGGCILTKEIEGCKIDLFSTGYPLFLTSKAYPLLQEDLKAHGVEFLSNDTPVANVLSDGSFAILNKNRNKNIKNFNALAKGDGDMYNSYLDFVGKKADFIFPILTEEIRTFKFYKSMLKYIWKNGFKNTFNDVASYLPSVTSDVNTDFKSKEVKALLAPWVLHVGLNVTSPFSTLMSKIICFSLEFVGLPFIKGGSSQIVKAFESMIVSSGGKIIKDTEISSIVLEKNQAVGVKSTKGNTYRANFIAANVTPTALYGKLLEEDNNYEQFEDAKRFKYNSKGNMQIHLILKGDISWNDKKLNDVGYIHLSDGIDSVSKAVNEASMKTLPSVPTICIGQPMSVDKSRAVKGKSILWIQLPECPYEPFFDGANTLNDICKGTWSDKLKEAYSERIIESISKHIPNLKEQILHKEVISPKDLSDINVNLVNGDPYSGECEVNQFLFFRPFKSAKNHETPYKNLFHIGASTHPGPGLSGGSGYHIYEKLRKM